MVSHHSFLTFYMFVSYKHFIGGYMRNLFNILDNTNNRSVDFTTLQNARLDVIGELEAICVTTQQI